MCNDFNSYRISNDNELRWNKLLSESYNSSYRLSYGFLDTKKDKIKKKETWIFTEKGIDIAGTVYFLKSDSTRVLKVAEIPAGFVFKNNIDLKLFPYILDHFLKWASSNKSAYARISPWLIMTLNDQFTENYQITHKVLESKGFKPINEGRHSYLVDLTKDLEFLLSKTNRSTRKIIRRSLKSDLNIKVYDKIDSELMDSFWSLYMSLANKKNFKLLDKTTFYEQVNGLFAREHVFLFAVYCSKQVVSYTLVSKLGIPQGMYGGIDIRFKYIENCISPGPISVWSIITTLKELGFKVYDMGFAPGKIPDETHPNYNVWLFKYNFGPDHIQFMPTYGKVIKQLRGRLFQRMLYKK
jgi:lipid II:glycine glycyltransferase (peptidoglycan interpeptide bridge formation enzyme)